MDANASLIAAQTPLDSVLHRFRVSGTSYCSGQFRSPWRIAVPPLHREGRFHLVTEGSAVVFGPGVEPVTLQRGDFILLPRGAGHHLADRLDDMRAVPETTLPDCRGGGCTQVRQTEHVEGLIDTADGVPDARMVTVSVRFEDATAVRLLAMLPAAIHVRADSPDRAAMDDIVQMIAAESTRSRVGGDAIVTRLADILVVQTIRWWVERQCADRLGWIGGLRDPQIGRAIALMHLKPEHPWSLPLLAREVGLSRSALALRFKELLGQPVMRYLASWRMHLALDSLRTPDARVDIGRLAEQVGYKSESAFNRAFKRHLGQPPGAARAARPFADPQR